MNCIPLHQVSYRSGQSTLLVNTSVNYVCKASQLHLALFNTIAQHVLNLLLILDYEVQNHT